MKFFVRTIRARTHHSLPWCNRYTVPSILISILVNCCQFVSMWNAQIHFRDSSDFQSMTHIYMKKRLFFHFFWWNNYDQWVNDFNIRCGPIQRQTKKSIFGIFLYSRLSMFHFLYTNNVPVRTSRIVWLRELPAWVILSRGELLISNIFHLKHDCAELWFGFNWFLYIFNKKKICTILEIKVK